MKKYLLISLILCSCAVTKDRNAVSRVTYNPALFNQIGRQWQVANPCSIDTVRSFINGKEVISYDTLFNNHTDTDTINRIKTIIKYIKKTDTLVTYVIDNRAINLAKGDLDKATGQITQLQSDISVCQKGSTQKGWWLIGISLFSVLAIGGLTFLLFKK